ncbi:Transposon Ty3-G Gag-Pol polyprotein [Sesamum angolense]|uniref:Transposon Ty3-G Gag-Pol polyprotein n=1 Tax=Sesamum angolense TaxID=2727404 RepID=A0AAE1X0V5_9LAMI|nr:Transposon Ty3-G Gag-Pol polyprotein [Sesamum angolense]
MSANALRGKTFPTLGYSNHCQFLIKHGHHYGFIEELPKSEGKNSILVTVDRFTNYAHCVALSHPFSAEMVAKIFLDHIYKLHGLPVNIVTDRVKVFTNLFWCELFKQLGTSLSLSTAYHPQSDGQMERVNQCFKNYLHCMCHLQPKHWFRWLALARHWYNTNFHTGLKYTPFQALYGYPPTPLSIDPYLPSHSTVVSDYMLEHNKMIGVLKANLQVT